MKSLGVILAVVAAAAIACQALATRLAMRRGRMVDVLLVNLFVSAAILTGVALVFVPDPVLTGTAVVAFIAAGISNLIVGRSLYFAGIERVGASRAEPIKASMPLFAAVFAVLLLGERVSPIQFGGIALIIVGITLVSWESANTDRLAGDDVPWIGLLLPLGAAVVFAIEPVIVDIGFREGTTAIVGAALKTVVGFLVLSTYASLQGSLRSVTDIPSGDVRWYLLAGIASAVSILAYYAGLEISRVGIVVPIMQTSPLVVVVLSAIFLRDIERVTPQLIVSACVIIAGAVTVTLWG